MFSIEYKPILFSCKTVNLIRRDNKTIFIFKNGFGQIKGIKVDESIERIKSRMNDVENKIRDKVYLTNGMMDIDISLLSNGKWQLFDEFDIYEFDM